MSESLSSDIIGLIAEHTEMAAEEITHETELDSLGIHSLELVEIIMDIEEKYDVEIELDAATASDSIKTIGDIISEAEKLVKGKA